MTITVKMKKFTFLLVLAIVSVGIGTVSAQSLQEVVYLKNGSVIRGTIIEQVPNESLKIQTSDGSVFAYKMADVEKISKEQVNGRSAGNALTGMPQVSAETDAGRKRGIGDSSIWAIRSERAISDWIASSFRLRTAIRFYLAFLPASVSVRTIISMRMQSRFRFSPICGPIC